MRKALVVGINHYDNYPALSGCIHDAKQMHKLLSHHEEVNKDKERNFHVEILTSVEHFHDERITRKKLQQMIHDLFDDEHSDVALFYFSGHGYENSLGGYLVTQDAEDYEEGVSVNDILIYANNSKIKDIVIILDCCYSGQIGSIPVLESGTAILRKGITILTSSGAHQVSLESRRKGGIFTNILVNALKGGAGDILGNVKTTHLYEHADDLLGPWDQRPSLKSNVSKVVTIRKTAPKVPRHVLSSLTKLFVVAGNHHKMNPSYLEGDDDATDENIERFRQFEMLFKQGLIEPHDAPTLNKAAKEGKACKLSGKGQFYWHMVNKGKI